MRSLTGIDDLQIWGFRHEPKYSPIWDAMTEIYTALSESKLFGKTAEELGSKLDRAFSEAMARDAYEEISLFRHKILGLFVSTRLKLEVAAERPGNSDESSMQRIRASLPVKKIEALRILEEGMLRLELSDRTTIRHIEAKRVAVVEILNDLPHLDAADTASKEFNIWLSRLTESLGQMRSSLI